MVEKSTQTKTLEELTRAVGIWNEIFPGWWRELAMIGAWAGGRSSIHGPAPRGAFYQLIPLDFIHRLSPTSTATNHEKQSQVWAYGKDHT